jgi:hypothetical protein
MHVLLFTPRIVITSPSALFDGEPAETLHEILESETQADFSHAVTPIRTFEQKSIHPKFAPLLAIAAIFPDVGAFGGQGKILSGLSKEKASEIEVNCSVTVTSIDADVTCPRALLATMEVSEVQSVANAEVPYLCNCEKLPSG